MVADRLSEDEDAGRHRALSDPSRRRILRTLRADGPSDIDRLTAATGLHPTTVRFHLQHLAGAGLVTCAPSARASRGRPRLVYSAVAPPVDREVRADCYQGLAEALVESIAATANSSGIAISAGRAWGRRQADSLSGGGDGSKQLVTLARRLGFGPEITGDTTVTLTSCPLLDVARRHPAVVCALHLGVLQGTLDELGTTQAVSGLQPFASPGRCIVTLAHRDGTAT